MRALLLALLVACDSGSTVTGDAPPGGGTADAPGGGSGSGGNLTAKQFCVSETNRYRAMNSKPALQESAQLEAYADQGAMVDFSSSPHNHFSSTNGGGIAFAENECPGQFGWNYNPGDDLNAVVGQCIAAFYAEGPGTDYNTHGHYINMMGNYASLGCGIYYADGKITIVQDYGN
jgi:uncharacterized protein YkwD